jgi:anionic cell wall polymer biosynthesis LytR-Cps2A-Psr (LCP) family protein
VDAIGGVEMDVPKTIHDNATGVTIKAGKQTLDGAKALAFVRTRKSAATPRSDLDRVVNQRKFIGALASEIASPATFLNPFDMIPLLSEMPDALTVDDGDHLYNLAGLGFAMGGIGDGGTITTTVPVTDGSATQWDETKSKQLWDALKGDTAVPKDVINN